MNIYNKWPYFLSSIYCRGQTGKLAKANLVKFNDTKRYRDENEASVALIEKVDEMNLNEYRAAQILREIGTFDMRSLCCMNTKGMP